MALMSLGACASFGGEPGTGAALESGGDVKSLLAQCRAASASRCPPGGVCERFEAPDALRAWTSPGPPLLVEADPRPVEGVANAALHVKLESGRVGGSFGMKTSKARQKAHGR